MQQVLLIDDDLVGRRSVLALLKRAEITAMTASTGAEGLKMIYLYHKDIMFVLLDIGLPDQNGFEIAQAVRADPFMIDIPFVVITGHRKPDIAKQAALLNIEHILYKPVSYAQISAIVERFRHDA